MKILYVGNFAPQHSTETHVAATLEDLGHELKRVQENDIQTGTLLRDVTDFAPDLVLWTRTWNGCISLRDLDEIHALGITTASFHLDLYVPLSREKLMMNDPFWATNHVFTPDGDPQSAQYFKDHGINHHWLKPGVFKPECKPGNYREEFAQDIVFIGTAYNYHSEWPYRTRLVEWLKANYGGWFKHYGQYGRSVRNQDLNDLLASAKIVIGDTLCPNFTHQNYWSDRIYETTGRGGFIIHPRIKGLETEFTDDEVAFYNYGDFEHLKQLIDWYRTNNDYREKVKAAGMARTLKEHTYHDRMQELLACI